MNCQMCDDEGKVSVIDGKEMILCEGHFQEVLEYEDDLFGPIIVPPSRKK